MGRREIDGEEREGMGDKCEERDEGNISTSREGSLATPLLHLT